MGSLPIGYGVNATAAQTLGVYMTIANGGVTRPLRLVDGTIDAAGVRHRAQGLPPHRVISSGTASILNELMRGVVTHGTGEQAAIAGYTVAGKTGTARKQPYDQHRYMASFAGFAPAEAPRVRRGGRPRRAEDQDLRRRGRRAGVLPDHAGGAAPGARPADRGARRRSRGVRMTVAGSDPSRPATGKVSPSVP